ncbi:MAG TPA: glycerol-3-phosphate 1-O-acyltransferase PlsY [Clostridiales bacterium]|jgi:glycerol-3-phosphate acyltransferase PlsY|nr:glycerol-3-phosphate 1-O-acyltransferase PlsY [Clostridiales bacterium]
MIRIVICTIIGYFLGSLSAGLMLTRNTGVDIRKQGSSNIGATNVLRLLGAKMGVLTFLGDFAKGLVACTLGYLIAGRNGAAFAGIFAVLGHNWPVFYDFRGGKGIATSTAVLLFLFPVPTLINFAIAVAVALISRYVSLASLSLISLSLINTIVSRPFFPDILTALILCVLGYWRHRANIERLISGTESKLFQNKKTE